MALVAISICAACKDPAPDTANDREASTQEATASVARPSTRGDASESDAFELLNALERCEFYHRGLLIDLGTDATDWRRGYGEPRFDDGEPTERHGAAFARLTAKRYEYDFWLDEAVRGVRVSARVHAPDGARMAAYIDGRYAVGSRVASGETVTVPLASTSGELAPGRHTLMLRLWRRGPASNGHFAEVDWVRIGRADESNEAAQSYAAPTFRDVVSDVVLDEKPKRALSLRAESAVRCPLQLGGGARLKVWLGFWGTGKGRAEIRLLRDGEAPVTLASRVVSGGGGATWTPLTVNLSPYASELVGLELEVLQATAGGRVAFGEPAIVRSDPPAAAAPATRTVILVIGSAIDRRDVPPWGAAAGLASIAELARAGAVFRDYRAPSTLPAATMASMLTALSPGTHGLRDQAARLGESMRNVGEIVKQAGGRAAMVTGVPTTFAAFGFAAGWDDYRMISPVHDIAATEPYTWAARWLAGELETEEPIKRLLVVHGRGAHPPWDLSKKEVMRLPPTGYTGPITARRGGIVLGQVRSRRARRIGDDDWERVNALTQAALVKQAAGLGQLLKVLRKNEAFNDALIIFVGDVGRGARPDVPYDPAGDPTEERLTVPLIVKFPGGAFAGKEVQVHATAVDIAVTILESLGLRVPEPATGVNLYQLARGREPVVGRALLATSGRHFATRYGSYRLSGEFGKVPRLCQLDIDPACVSDKFGTATLVGPASWQQTFEALRRAEQLALRLGRKPDDRVPADIDPETAAALAVWGDIPPPSAPSPSPEP